MLEEKKEGGGEVGLSSADLFIPSLIPDCERGGA